MPQPKLSKKQKPKKPKKSNKLNFSKPKKQLPIKKEWRFFKGYDIPGNDFFKMPTKNPMTNAKKCKELNAVAFNSNGWIKKRLKPKSKWVKWSDSPKDGIFVLKKAYNELIKDEKKPEKKTKNGQKKSKKSKNAIKTKKTGKLIKKKTKKSKSKNKKVSKEERIQSGESEEENEVVPVVDFGGILSKIAAVGAKIDRCLLQHEERLERDGILKEERRVLKKE